ncbi:hypothetical protein [Streptoalloteichus hindustanus]|uniref:hypothetical protein n=1 Tax=Streptoalloteichus hindustanus TaxID=2017 RepID=UPI0011613F56|nr:hypothetical protein [Streptoalloteichus hindustanus]
MRWVAAAGLLGVLVGAASLAASPSAPTDQEQRPSSVNRPKGGHPQGKHSRGAAGQDGAADGAG